MQRYIGNIVVNNLNYKVDNCFKKVKSLDDIENGLPVLIVGLENAREILSSEFNILNREYRDGQIWWTLSKTEKRIDYDKNIDDFYDYCINNLLSNTVYENINIINLNYSNAKRYIEFIRNKDKKYYFNHNNKFIFVYYTKENNNIKYIYGISLNTSAFFGISKKKLINLIKNNDNNIEIKNFYSIPNKVRKLINDDIVSKMVLNGYFMEK